MHRLLAGVCVIAAAAVQAQPAYVNVTAGGPLRPGVYGRILFRDAPPPPVISSQPMVATQVLGPAQGQPVYLYVPPGHVRKWPRHCRKYEACDVPVYFVRMDDNPGKLGRWKKRERGAGSAPLRFSFADARS
jgi:hypothetical protein